MPTAIKPRMSDAAVELKTGKTWARWFELMDAAGAKKMSHQEIVGHLSAKHGVGPW
jgi:3-methyladenine DNA glycosylase/8-oxoguanine DNA glycosylase